MPRSSSPAASKFLEKPGRREDDPHALDQQLDAGVLQFVQHGLHRGLLVADG